MLYRRAMNEQLGGNDDELNENEQFNFDSLDSEWEALNKAIEKLPEQDMKDLQLIEDYQKAHDAITRRIEYLGIPHVISASNKTQSELYREFTFRYYDQKREEFGGTDEEFEEQMGRRVQIEAIYAYFDEREFESAVFNAVMRLLVLSNVAESPDVIEYIGLVKKQLQGEIFVVYRRGLDDDWQVLVDDMVMGEGLNIENIYDMAYLHLARIKLYAHEEQRKRQHDLITKAKEILKVDEVNGELEQVMQTTMDLLNMHAIAAEPIYNERERANRNAALWEWVRVMEVNDTAARQLINLLDEAYPIETE